MVTRSILVVACLLACPAGQATRPGYWDSMWALNVATMCWAQDAKYRDTPLGTTLPRQSPNFWEDFDRRPYVACARRLERIPDALCAGVTNLDAALLFGNLSPLREKFAVESWQAEQSLSYLDEARTRGRSDVPCPADQSTAPKEVPPLDEQQAVCVAVQQPPAASTTEPQYSRMDMASITRLAEAGDLGAQNEMGRRFGMGTWVRKDSATSAGWYRRAAEKGYAAAQANLSYMYLQGEGVQRDHEQAREWARKAAAQGNATARMNLAYMYGTGIGVAKDGRQAERCYLLAAKQGSTAAQQALARMYSRGDGVPVDKGLSLLWFQRSREGARTGKPWQEQ